jgi:hypothetical protein
MNNRIKNTESILADRCAKRLLQSKCKKSDAIDHTAVVSNTSGCADITRNQRRAVMANLGLEVLFGQNCFLRNLVEIYIRHVSSVA